MVFNKSSIYDKSYIFRALLKYSKFKIQTLPVGRGTFSLFTIQPENMEIVRAIPQKQSSLRMCIHVEVLQVYIVRFNKCVTSNKYAYRFYPSSCHDQLLNND